MHTKMHISTQVHSSTSASLLLQARACEQLAHTVEVIVADANKLASLHNVDSKEDRSAAVRVFCLTWQGKNDGHWSHPRPRFVLGFLFDTSSCTQ
jgi:hypothetical protein